MKGKNGICQLTGVRGKFVRSHLIPNAFMRRVSDEPFIEFDGKNRPKRAYTGWYDSELVIAKGEKILALFDQVAVSTFLKKDLLYRDRRSNDYQITTGRNAFDVVRIECSNFKTLRLFALSLLWRAAKTKLEFGNSIQLSENKVAKIQNYLLNCPTLESWNFPTFFCFYDDSEEIAKISPDIVIIDGVEFSRFFLDGVVLFQSMSFESVGHEKFGDLILNSNEITLLCLPASGSDLAKNQSRLANEMLDDHFNSLKIWSKSRNLK